MNTDTQEDAAMNKQIVTKPVFKLIGLSVVTNNADEQNPATAKIGPLVAQYMAENVASRIPNRENPGVMFSVYTDYESDHQGNYTYLIGEEVSSFEDVPSDLHCIIVPTGQYQRFTTHAGKIPDVIIQAWQTIWGMSKEALGGARRYIADFEIYDHRAADPMNAVADIYIGIK